MTDRAPDPQTGGARAAPVVTRFAPSPTGFLHIGGARTALFNWLYARGCGGRFLLRIEDTDRERSTDAATAAILDGLRWLGLDWDGEPVSQHARAAEHVKIAENLLARGAAYRCYVPAAELAAQREAANAQLDKARALKKEAAQLKKTDAAQSEALLSEAAALQAKADVGLAAFRSPWRDRDPADAPDGAPFVVRFKGPLEGETIVDDAVQGPVRFAHKDLDDLVLLRADGGPTYNLAVVADDHAMGVTHVIRGDDHLVNAARQSLLYRALGWDTPVFAHIPLIHGADGKKLSKRHGALGAEAYRTLGYLPEGLRNYLLRLGWAHGDQEIFSQEEALAAFDLNGINKAAARLDIDKLNDINAHHLRRAGDARVFALALAWREWTTGAVMNETHAQRLLAGVQHLKERSQTLPDVVAQAAFLLAPRPLAITAKARKALKDEALPRLGRARDVLAQIVAWDEHHIHEALHTFAETEEVGFGKVGAPLRAALTGGAPAPDLPVVFALLGREESLARLDDVLTQHTIADDFQAPHAGAA